MESRLTELEIRYEYQEQTINQLNEIIIAQQKQIDHLILRVNDLQEKLEATQLQIGPANEKPPHY